MIITSISDLQKVPPPRLPDATLQYDPRYIDNLNNILRIYFSRLTASFEQLQTSSTGAYFVVPYAAVQRTTDKTFTVNTATQITFDQNDYLNGCLNPGTDGIEVVNAGLYNYQFSIQFANTDTQIHTAWVWLRKNGVDVPGTASKFDVPNHHGSSDGYLIAACNFYIDLAAGDTIEMWAAVNNTGVYMEAYPAQTSPFAMPSTPSVVATLTYVSMPPAI